MDESVMLHGMRNAAFASPFTSNIHNYIWCPETGALFVNCLCQVNVYLCVCASVCTCITFPWFTEAYCRQSEAVLVRPSALIISSFESDIWALLQNIGLARSWLQTQGCLKKHMSRKVVPSAHAFHPLSLRIQYSALFLKLKHR